MTFKKLKEISGHAGAIYTCAATQKYIYTGSADHFVTRWLIEEGVQDQFAIKFEHSIYAVTLLSGNRLACGLSDGSIHIFELINRVEIKYFTQHTKAIFSMCFDEELKRLIVGDADGNLSVWKDDLTLEIYLPLNVGKIRAIQFTADKKAFVIGGQDGVIRIFDLTTYNEVGSWFGHKDGVTSLCFHPFNEDILYSGGKDARLKVWNWKEAKELQSIIAHTYAIYDIIPMQDGVKLITASRDKNIKEWNINDLSIVQRLDVKKGGHKHSVNSLAKISETEFVSCSDDKRVIVWGIS